MKLRLNCPRIVSGLAAGTIGGLLLTGVAYALTSNNGFVYSRAQRGYLWIAPAALHPVASGLGFGVGANPAEAGSNGCLIADVQLPNGAKMNSVEAFYAANEAAGVTFAFDRDAPASGVARRLAHGISTVDNGARSSMFEAIPANLATVDNRGQTYAFAVCFADAGQKFYGARVNYTYISAGD